MQPVTSNNHPQSAENNAFSNLRSMKTIMPLLDVMTSTELSFDKVAEHAMIALDQIGNSRRARYAVAVEVFDGFAELPSNCEQVEAVFSSWGQSGAGQDGEWDAWLQGPSVAADQIGGSYRFNVAMPIFIPTGAQRYVDYTFRDGGLYVGRQASYRELVQAATGLGRCSSVLDTAVENEGSPLTLHVFYRGEITDEDGYRLITPEEALACAYFTNSVVTYKRYQSKEAGRQEWLDARDLATNHIAKARTAPLASSNALDNALDEGKSYHRHFITDDLRVQ